VRHGIPTGKGSKDLLFSVDLHKGTQRNGHVVVRQHGSTP
jgi:hypothetical protein